MQVLFGRRGNYHQELGTFWGTLIFFHHKKQAFFKFSDSIVYMARCSLDLIQKSLISYYIIIYFTI